MQPQQSPSSAFQRIGAWLKYDRPANYPALSAFDRAEALKRLQAYEREERKVLAPWPNILGRLNILLLVIWVVEMHWDSIFLIAFQFVICTLGCVAQYYLYRRVRRRVELKVAAELGGGRLWRCVECGYDLRASASRCPECGASVHVLPPE